MSDGHYDSMTPHATATQNPGITQKGIKHEYEKGRLFMVTMGEPVVAREGILLN